MPTFLKDLRRLSRHGSSIKGDKPPNNHSSDSSENAHVPSNKSTSTINTTYDSATTPPSLPSEKSSNSSGLPPVPPKPPLHPSHSARYSIVGASSLNLALSTPSPSSRNQLPSSQYAPRILSVSDNSWVHQKILLIYGQIADPSLQAYDGQVWVCHHQDTFPATCWPVSDSHFKALVHLQPGPNRLRLDFLTPKLPPPSGLPAHSSWISINYLPLISSPPLDLVILLGKDSPGIYDAAPDKINREGNGLDTAIRKFKMSAYLWQAFTGEQMNRNGFGRRCFRFEEEWQPGTLSSRDVMTGQMRNEAKIHTVRTQKTIKELRDSELAQQNHHASKPGELFGIAGDAVRDYFQLKPGQTRYVSVLLLDTHWDPKAQLVRGHAALGGGGGDGLQLAIFGSHALQSYPSSIEEVVPAFTDCTRTDTSYVANDLNESGSSWEAANVGIGSHMHETGHLFGCPHQVNGIMARGCVHLNRTFTTREPFSMRTKSPGQRLCLPQDECAWHRLDVIRFRFHPCFALPSDMPLHTDKSVQVWTVDNGMVLITAPTGITFVELYEEGEDTCKAHLEYLDGTGASLLPKQLSLTESDLRARVNGGKGRKKLRLDVHSAGGGQYKVEDFGQLVSKSSRVKLPDGRTSFKGGKLGFSQMDGSQPQEIFLWYATDSRKLLRSVRVYHGCALDGIEFCYEDLSRQMFGKKGGTPGGSEFGLDIRRGEVITGFYLRAGLWIDGIQILTSLGRKSDIYGDPTGGSGHTLIPPRGYSIAGLSGSCAQWVDGFSLMITR